MRIFKHRRWLFLTLFMIALVAACKPFVNNLTTKAQHNFVIFVADGLRPTSINSTDMPALNGIR